MGEGEDQTTGFYAANASQYADHCGQPSTERLEQFLARIRPSPEILELGCGNGRDSAWMLKRGVRVTPTDGTPEMAAEATRRLGLEVAVLRFEDLDAADAFDGVWANACLLHVPRTALRGILARIFKALRQGGVFYASFKAGEAEGLDGLGRYYNYPSRDWLLQAYGTSGWASVDIEEIAGSAYDLRPTQWLHVTATKAWT